MSDRPRRHQRPAAPEPKNATSRPEKMKWALLVHATGHDADGSSQSGDVSGGTEMSTAERYRAAHRAAFDRVAAGGGSLPRGGQRQLAQDLSREFGIAISQATVSRASHGAAAGANYTPSNRWSTTWPRDSAAKNKTTPASMSQRRACPRLYLSKRRWSGSCRFSKFRNRRNGPLQLFINVVYNIYACDISKYLRCIHVYIHHTLVY